MKFEIGQRVKKEGRLQNGTVVALGKFVLANTDLRVAAVLWEWEDKSAEIEIEYQDKLDPIPCTEQCCLSRIGMHLVIRK